MSKALATIATQPLIVAKVGLQSKPPPSRQGKPFKGFVEVMQFIIKNEGPMGLFKGITPQILKGFMVQGILMMTKERYVYLFWAESLSPLIPCISIQSKPLLTTTWKNPTEWSCFSSSSSATYANYAPSSSPKSLSWLPRPRPPRPLPPNRAHGAG